jgi:hypothetical protein
MFLYDIISKDYFYTHIDLTAVLTAFGDFKAEFKNTITKFGFTPL